MTITNTQSNRRELAVLFSMILKHPCMTPGLQEKIIGAFSDIHPMVDQYASAEGIELYLEAYAIQDGLRAGAA